MTAPIPTPNPRRSRCPSNRYDLAQEHHREDRDDQTDELAPPGHRRHARATSGARASCLLPNSWYSPTAMTNSTVPIRNRSTTSMTVSRSSAPTPGCDAAVADELDHEDDDLHGPIHHHQGRRRPGSTARRGRTGSGYGAGGRAARWAILAAAGSGWYPPRSCPSSAPRPRSLPRCSAAAAPTPGTTGYVLGRLGQADLEIVGYHSSSRPATLDFLIAVGPALGAREESAAPGLVAVVRQAVGVQYGSGG